MTDLTQLAPHEILARIENRNRRFKLASAVFGGVLIAGLVVILVIGLETLQGVDTQLTSQKRLLNSQQQILNSIKAGSDQNASNVKDLQNHIDCIVELLRQPDRQNLTIKDLNGCQFDKNGNITTGAGVNNGKANNPTGNVHDNGGAASRNATSQPAAQSTPTSSTAPKSASKGALIGATDKLFCPISLTSFACSN